MASMDLSPTCRCERERTVIWSFGRSAAGGEHEPVAVEAQFYRGDFREPPLTLVGHNHAADAAPTKALYQEIEAPLIGTTIRVAEMMTATVATATNISTASPAKAAERVKVLISACQRR